MQNSKCSPKSRKEYSSTDLNASLKGTSFVVTAANQTMHDTHIADDMIIDGAVLSVIHGGLGDKITCQVVDKDNVLGYGINTVLGQYVTDWHINPSSTTQLNYESEYPAKIYTGLYLRIIYTPSSTPSAPITVIINYKLHKLLW